MNPELALQVAGALVGLQFAIAFVVAIGLLLEIHEFEELQEVDGAA